MLTVLRSSVFTGAPHSSASHFPSQPHPGWHSHVLGSTLESGLGLELGLRSHALASQGTQLPQMRTLVLLVSAMALVATAVVGGPATRLSYFCEVLPSSAPSSPGCHWQTPQEKCPW